jgi:hypothetical protein
VNLEIALAFREWSSIGGLRASSQREFQGSSDLVQNNNKFSRLLFDLIGKFVA